jgi:hypothetical protein
MYLSWQATRAASSPTSSCAGNANQLDRPARSDRVLLRRGYKPLVAPLGAEVVGLPPVLLARRGRGRVDLIPHTGSVTIAITSPSVPRGPGNHASAVQWNKTTSRPSRLTRWMSPGGLTGAPSMLVYVGCSRVSFVTPWPMSGRVRAAPRPGGPRHTAPCRRRSTAPPAPSPPIARRKPTTSPAIGRLGGGPCRQGVAVR